ncbi:hypothetical protein PHYBLDRAFT_173296 [Phycomyces blakesleeanus NRRL 1555(-)]|uniref:Uncharacterized protein n=1 Tax=Phycomyces blakesleeanus (strain ATCC 8743b / DSM 1359 / FGSC 10004 / NBRC 33097 / NRRL 1555) TaxID=763407 RepID=A0A163D2Q5_PHYB8|nr:hypothetical protein PHYBLDRAFT_173296 [Phycomyces blakesleeanus NRRL 1555(-)]OAD68290.1 hypothetical protein PHYBLDRAFT_173296 [Phycomyces blakesleeanus NRRL 1555(-)]|eukprot:XP_018286330.1 hypothetical protein PHYBLDRAFT_173296 [Phycomyces blakesleeanus NRRL 1555(-)]
MSLSYCLCALFESTIMLDTTPSLYLQSRPGLHLLQNLFFELAKWQKCGYCTQAEVVLQLDLPPHMIDALVSLAMNLTDHLLCNTLMQQFLTIGYFRIPAKELAFKGCVLLGLSTNLALDIRSGVRGILAIADTSEGRFKIFGVENTSEVIITIREFGYNIRMFLV